MGILNDKITYNKDCLTVRIGLLVLAHSNLNQLLEKLFPLKGFLNQLVERWFLLKSFLNEERAFVFEHYSPATKAF